tara:strand:- start:592 stop:1128 length:537 start_codon:yes stop_codon:yes gene_type:complete
MTELSYKVTLHYKNEWFNSDMKKRNLLNYTDIHHRHFPETGPYEDVHDFFQWYYGIEEGNLLIKAQEKIENEFITSGKMAKDMKLTDDAYGVEIRYAFNSVFSEQLWHARDCDNPEKIEEVIKELDYIQHKTRVVLAFDINMVPLFKRYKSPATSELYSTHHDVVDRYFTIDQNINLK